MSPGGPRDFEMHADGGADLIRELAPTGVDVLVQVHKHWPQP
jgi:hypothetical protein